jgi:hypothetical protein
MKSNKQECTLKTPPPPGGVNIGQSDLGERRGKRIREKEGM